MLSSFFLSSKLQDLNYFFLVLDRIVKVLFNEF
jgi:hypothetical protein